MAGAIEAICQTAVFFLQLEDPVQNTEYTDLTLWQVYDTGPRDATGSPLVCLPPIGGQIALKVD